MGDKPKTMLELLQLMVERENHPVLTKKEFTRIRNEGTPEQLEEAVAKMMEQGGYENLV